MSGDAPAGLPAAGWYPDLTNPGHERLWTGERWIAWIRPNQADKVEANPAGWRPDVGAPGFERLWSGEMWTDEIRRVGEAGVPALGVTAPGAATAGGVAAGAVPAIATSMTGATATGPVLLAPPTTPRRGAIYHDASSPVRLATLGGIVQAALGLTILVQLAQLIVDQRYIGVQSDMLSGRLPDLGHVESVVNSLHAVFTARLIIYGVTAILFVIWFFQAYRNLVRTGIQDLRYAPGWAIGAWFIPLFNLVRPKQIADDIWRGTESMATVGPERRDELRLPGMLNRWWGLWIVGGLLSGIANHAINRANAEQIFTLSSLSDERTGVWTLQAGLVALTVAATMALLLVREITRKQDERFRPPAAASPSR